MRSSPPRSAAPTPSTKPATASRSSTARGRGCRRLLIDQFPGRTRETYVRKQVGPDTRIDRVTVKRRAGLLARGASHSLLYEDPNGTVLDIPARLAGPTLVWRHGDRTLRLEADVTKSRALAIARSIP